MHNVYTYFNGTDGTVTRRGRVPVTPPAPDPTTKTLLDVTFDDWALGSPSVSYWNTRMANGLSSGVASELGRHEVIVNPDGPGKVMELTLLGGVRAGAGSTSMFVPLKQTTDDVTVEYRFKLVGANYDFGLGQKFPGPSGVRPGISAGFPSGGNTVVDEGFSVRGMQATHSGHADGTGLTYVYGSDVAASFGQDNWWNSVLPRDAWMVRKVRVKMNTIGAFDGIIDDKLDGVTKVLQTNRQLRVRSDVHATHLMWHFFYGGSTADWAPDTDQHIQIDYIKITAAV